MKRLQYKTYKSETEVSAARRRLSLNGYLLLAGEAAPATPIVLLCAAIVLKGGSHGC